MSEKTAHLVITTTDSADSARQIARAMIESKLCACAQIDPKINSIYPWKGNIAEDQECRITFKTSSKCLNPLLYGLKKAHPYDIPEILVQTVTIENHDYVEWMNSWLEKG